MSNRQTDDWLIPYSCFWLEPQWCLWMKPIKSSMTEAGDALMMQLVRETNFNCVGGKQHQNLLKNLNMWFTTWGLSLSDNWLFFDNKYYI